MRRRSYARNSLEYCIALGVLNSLALSPRSVSERLARAYTRLLDRALPRLRRTAMRNLKLALPELGADRHAKIVDGVFRSIARLLVSFAYFPRMNGSNISEWIRYEGFEHFEEAS